MARAPAKLAAMRSAISPMRTTQRAFCADEFRQRVEGKSFVLAPGDEDDRPGLGSNAFSSASRFVALLSLT